MCKVCRVWSDLSLALFSYACRPNFHHKYLTLTDPVLSLREEALISSAYMCRKAQMPKMKLCINVHFGAETCIRVCMNVWSHRGPSSALWFSCKFSSLSIGLRRLACLQDDTVRCQQKPTLLRSRSAWGQTVFCLSSLFTPFLCLQRLFISPGSDEENKADDYMKRWDSYVLPLPCFAEFLISSKHSKPGLNGPLLLFKKEVKSKH